MKPMPNALRAVLPGQHDARPQSTSLQTGPAVPAIALRLTLAALSLSATAALATVPEHLWVGLAIGALLAVWPHALAVAACVAVLIGMFGAVGQHSWQLPVLVAVTHAVLRLGAVAGSVSWGGRVELAVLRGALPGFLGIQVIAQVAAALALALDGAAPVPWVVVAAVAALAVLCWAMLRSIRRVS